MPLSEPVSFHVKQKLTRVLSVFHATTVSVTITDRFYATGPWFDWHVAWVPFIRGLGTAAGCSQHNERTFSLLSGSNADLLAKK